MVILTGLLLGLFLYPLVGQANDGGKFGVGVRGGWYKVQDASDGKLYGGLQARWKLFPALAIEGLVDYRPEEPFLEIERLPVTRFWFPPCSTSSPEHRFHLISWSEVDGTILK